MRSDVFGCTSTCEVEWFQARSRLSDKATAPPVRRSFSCRRPLARDLRDGHARAYSEGNMVGNGKMKEYSTPKVVECHVDHPCCGRWETHVSVDLEEIVSGALSRVHESKAHQHIWLCAASAQAGHRVFSGIARSETDPEAKT